MFTAQNHTQDDIRQPLPGWRALIPFLAAAIPATVLVGVLSLLLLPPLRGGAPLAGLLPGLMLIQQTGLFLVVVAVAAIGLVRHYPHRRLGLCNVVTLLRAALAVSLVTLFLTGLQFPPNDLTGHRGTETAWLALAIAIAAFALDGVDGWLARRSGLTSSFGARFDVEIDAALTVILTVIAVNEGKIGAWGYLIPGLRYLFVAAGPAMPWLTAPLPERFSRKVACVVQIGTLVALLCPWVTPPLAPALALVTLALLMWSFAVDIRWLSQNREAGSA